MAPWLLFSPVHVLFYVHDEDMLRQLSNASGVCFKDLQLLVGLISKKRKRKDGSVYNDVVTERADWQLFSSTKWIQREDDPKEILAVGHDVDHFMQHVVTTRKDMYFFTPDRLTRFIHNNLFGSSKKPPICESQDSDKK